MAVFITEDKWVKLGGRLDPDDEAVMDEVRACDGKVLIMNIKEAFDVMKAEDSTKFKEFHRRMEKTAGKSLTFKQLVEFSRTADRRFGEFAKLAQVMTKGQASLVQRLRVEQHFSWRAIARACHTIGWEWATWAPPSNQLMGIALCQRAAQILGGDARSDPWN